MSRTLVDNLRSQLQGALDAWDRDLLSLDLAIALAQSGGLDEGREALAGLRSRSQQLAPRAGIKLVIAEGVLDYYLGKPKHAFDRLERACALARASGDRQLHGLASVWLGQVGFNCLRYDMLMPCLRVVGSVPSDEMTVQVAGRFSLLVADVCQYAIGIQESEDWYSWARQFARQSVDRGLMAAIEYNRFAIGISRLRLDYVMHSTGYRSSNRDWLAELGSIRRFQDFMSVSVLNDFTRLCELIAAEVTGNFDLALRCIDDLRNSPVISEFVGSSCMFDLEEMWCRSMGGNGSAHSHSCNAGQLLEDLEEVPASQSIVGVHFLVHANEAFNLGLDRHRLDDFRHRVVKDFFDDVHVMATAAEYSKEFRGKFGHLANGTIQIS